jgi:hypothetical protein
VHNREKADILHPIKICTNIYTNVKANSAECQKTITLNDHGIGDASYNTYAFVSAGMDMYDFNTLVLGKA